MKSIFENARELAEAHRRADPQTKVIKFFPPNGVQEIRLLEISDTAPVSGEALPFTFGADPAYGVNYQSTVILLNPQEWNDVLRGNIPLPAGWDLAKAEDL